jgi:hypothetical protein
LKQEEEKRKREELAMILEENNRKIEEAQRKLVRNALLESITYYVMYHSIILFVINFYRPKNVWPWCSSRGKWRRIASGCSENTRKGCEMSSS